MTIHHLKIWPEFYEPIIRREKTYEIRFNDRNFQKGDELHLREWDWLKQKYTGRAASVRVLHVTYGTDDPLQGLFPSNCCVMGIELFTEIP